MDSDKLTKAIVVLSVLAMIVSIGSVTFCIMESNESDDYGGVKYTLYIGLDTLASENDDVENDVKALLHSEKQGYTLFEAEGGYDMGQTYITEKTLVFIINNCGEELIRSIVDLVYEKYHLAIMVEKQRVKADIWT